MYYIHDVFPEESLPKAAYPHGDTSCLHLSLLIPCGVEDPGATQVEPRAADRGGQGPPGLSNPAPWGAAG